MFNKVLIANRGAIAVRIIRTLRKMGIQSVAVYSDADRLSPHVLMADESAHIGPSPASQSYLREDAILRAGIAHHVDAIHPGYGFLSENPDFAAAVENAGMVFIGPSPEQMRSFGLKHTAREIAHKTGVPLLPGSGLLSDVDHVMVEAKRIGFPVMLKSTAGGGGIGMQLIWDADTLQDAYTRVARLARTNFKEAGIYLEKYVQAARHIEVQIFGDGNGQVVHLGERDCSVQRRNQKVIEETPAPNLPTSVRLALCDTAVRLMQSVCYRNAGTVEFILDADSGDFYFLEVNTRLQVEHGVSEEVSGVDLVEWMVRQAAGESPISNYVHSPRGHSIQVRLYAEDPGKDFQPAAGMLSEVIFPQNARVDTWVEAGSEVTAYYDPMLAKIIVLGKDRDDALSLMGSALESTKIYGFETNLAYLRQIVADGVFEAGRQTTQYLTRLGYHAPTVYVIEPGVQTSLQDWPGRLGYWDVGVPPSGPMDSLAHRVANRLLNNAPDAATLEITLSGPTLKFNDNCIIAVTGAELPLTLDGQPLDLWRSHSVCAGSVLEFGKLSDIGCRSYLAVSGGFDAPLYLGSRATFSLGQFGGHVGRVLRTGDVLHIGSNPRACPDVYVDKAVRPTYNKHWEIAVHYGPHGAPDFFTADDVDMLFATDWEVHYNSNRTGVRLIGPRPQWARSDGGEAGLHPSNIHDNAYAIGAMDFTGDMPILLGPDGPSLGGFVCPAVIVAADLWKMGQLRPGDTVRFLSISLEEAARLELTQDTAIESLSTPLDPPTTASPVLEAPIVVPPNAQENEISVVYRVAGDKYLLVEYGPPILDLELRFRVHALIENLRLRCPAGIVDLTPGIRSLQIHYDNRVLSLAGLLELLRSAEEELPAVDLMEVPTRIVYLPLSWDDPATQQAIDKYMAGVRKDAPWCPSNIEFIRRINGLDSIEEVRRIVFDASYLVLGLGDVYLGAPVATPLDPRHRLVTTKYNPARTWTPENAVGIGGAYMCVYGMEGPGGYQFVGRTLQMWNRWRQTAQFTDGKPWLLRFFDQIRFFPVSTAELETIRTDFLHGRYVLDIREDTFRIADYRHFLAKEADDIALFRDQQRQAFAEERERWIQSGQANWINDVTVAEDTSDIDLNLAAGARSLASPLAGSIWKILVKAGDHVQANDTLIILESMKMEMTIEAPFSGVVDRLLCREGEAVSTGQNMLILTET
ncbi:urea carboxylase [Acidithiobacillus ferriphilus]|uniref:urea carboxylase n=1 Tax=Acidithiobacillus ferriphilus TaxID=1689834 RepID=UPI001C072F8E|nr:urea carboxylase [Acidithiobacillus ferriphilus]MBU2854373.1 urea carboxylase [Acidithiobacillus ferriphilus]